MKNVVIEKLSSLPSTRKQKNNKIIYVQRDFRINHINTSESVCAQVVVHLELGDHRVKTVVGLPALDYRSRTHQMVFGSRIVHNPTELWLSFD